MTNIIHLFDDTFLDLTNGETFTDRRKGEDRRREGRKPLIGEGERRREKRYIPSRQEILTVLENEGIFCY